MKTKKARAVKKAKKTATRAVYGLRLPGLAGRPTKAQFVKVYGPQGPKMTWEQRAKAGVERLRASISSVPILRDSCSTTALPLVQEGSQKYRFVDSRVQSPQPDL